MSKSAEKRVAVVGATGLVGQTIAAVLEERGFPVRDYIPLATGTSGARRVSALGKSWNVLSSNDVDFSGIDVCFFTAGSSVSRELVPKAIDGGCRIVDNTTAYRMDPDVPLVVPEINGDEVSAETSLVSCPNCTAINLVMAIGPIMRAVPIERVVVTSFQSVSGAGKEAVAEMETQARCDLDGKPVTAAVFPKPIAFNCLPRIGDVVESGYTVEEEKIIEETQKIFGKPDLQIVPTAVRVPVHVGHGLSINVELTAPLGLDDARALWRDAPGVDFDDDLPTQRDVATSDTVVVGRLRRDLSRPHALSFWVVGNNLRKGAATNSVQIAELWTNP